MFKILHITPHLGGGVGKCVSELIMNCNEHSHIVCLLEKPKNSLFITILKNFGTLCLIEPTTEELNLVIQKADIVQIEFWNHPTLIKFLCSRVYNEARWIVWCHISGTYFPKIPSQLPQLVEKFIVTTEASLNLEYLHNKAKSRIDFISSGVVSIHKNINRTPKKKFNCAYIGTLSKCKIHSDFVYFLSHIKHLLGSFKFYGDLTDAHFLMNDCEKNNMTHAVEFKGFTNDILTELNDIDILIYLLNPKHYGTAENALLEAMSKGVIPVVLPNPAETNIVKHRFNGLVIENPKELTNEITWLVNNPQEQLRISKNAKKFAITNHSTEILTSKFKKLYKKIGRVKKAPLNFKTAFGSNPFSFFKSFIKSPNDSSRLDEIMSLAYSLNPHLARADSKGSAIHFHKVFPESNELKQCVNYLSNS